MKPCVFSPCGNYRYTLWREFGEGNFEANGFLNIIGLNPSTANDAQDDPTIRRCMGFAKDWGYGGLCMTNLFAWRATEPLMMMGSAEPIGADNDKWLTECASKAGAVVAAWGTHGAHMGRGAAVVAMLAKSFVMLRCFGLTKDGSPKHPLYLPKSTLPVEFVVA